LSSGLEWDLQNVWNWLEALKQGQKGHSGIGEDFGIDGSSFIFDLVHFDIALLEGAFSSGAAVSFHSSFSCHLTARTPDLFFSSPNVHFCSSPFISL